MLLNPANHSADATLSTLQSGLRRIAVAGFFVLLICAGALTALTGLIPALYWLLTASALYALGCQQTAKRLHLNRRDALSALYPDLGWANRMTLGRGWLIAAAGGFLVIPDVLDEFTVLVWITAGAYSVAAIFDRVDGFIARKSQRSSLLGAELDTVFDALGLMVAPLLALQLGKIHVSYLLVSVAYYLFVLGLQWRERHHKPVYPLAPSKLRRTLAGFQMAYVAVVLWPPFQSDVTVLAGFGFMLPLLTGFVVDWYVVSGRINPYAAGTALFFQRLYDLTHTLLLPAVRITVLAALMYILSQSSWPVLSVAIALVSALLITTGLAGRAGAMLLLMLLAWTPPLAVYESATGVYEPAMVVLLYAAIMIVLLGCGRFSLWQADDDWVNRQDGA